ncbi:MAG: hypothetical protein HUJ25_06700 [Crocinitomicaceae bacterium]|nr:hypothetical protein [Crocinitomicaceae bacterium]
MRERLLKFASFLKIFGAVIFSLLFIGFGFETTLSTPDYALIFVDENSYEYFSPPCLMEEGYDSVEEIVSFAEMNELKVYKKSEIKRKGLKQNPDCREQEGFVQEGRSITVNILVSLGLFSESETRWNEDGSWKE